MPPWTSTKSPNNCKVYARIVSSEDKIPSEFGDTYIPIEKANSLQRQGILSKLDLGKRYPNSFCYKRRA